MLFGSRMLNKEVNIKRQNDNIERISITKVQCVFINEIINRKAHVKYIQSKLSKCTAIAHRCSHLFDRNSKCILYNTLFLPYLNYCVEIWENTYPTDTNNIFYCRKELSELYLVQDDWNTLTHFSKYYMY